MPRSLVDTLRAAGLALTLALAVPLSAEPKPLPTPPPVGATREQVVDRLGEPKSQLKAGPREVLFFSHWKVTLRYDVVVENEELADEPPPPPPRSAEAPAALAKPGDAAASPSTASTTPAASTETPAPAAVTDGTSPAKAADGANPAGAAPKPVREAEPALEIRIIRRPPAGATKPAQAAVRPVTQTAPTPRPVPAAAAAATAPMADATTAGPVATAVMTATESAKATTPEAPAPVAKEPTAVARDQPAPPAETATGEAKSSPTAVEAAATGEATTTESAAPTEPAEAPRPTISLASRLLIRRHRDNATQQALSVISAQTYVLAAVALGCVVVLFWRRSQRRAELDATTVSNTPFSAPAADTGATFTADMLAKLDAARFERLVASYYTKTGVVAELANAGADAAIHIKIFWKGEPKPFAGVQCHARPPTLIPVKPLQDLFEALTAAEIRRGYVVTTGKFNVEARDFAEEKHFTLLSGDLFLEKLNALPPAARSELLKETAVEPVVSADRAAT